MPETVEIYEGELFRSCHDAVKYFCSKHNLNWPDDSAEHKEALENIAREVIAIAQEENPTKEIKIIKKP